MFKKEKERVGEEEVGWAISPNLREKPHLHEGGEA